MPIGAPAVLLILAGVIAVGTPAPLASQLAAASAGSHVRVKAPTVQKRPIIGTLLSPITDSVKIEVYMGHAAAARRWVIPVSSIETLEVSMGRSSAAGRALGVKVGSLLALGVGAFFAVAFKVTPDPFDGSETGIGPAIGIGALATGVTILPLMAGGAIVGSIVRKEKWRPLYPVSQ